MVQDWFKLIASEHRFDAGAFELPNLDQVLERPLTRGAARAMTTIDRLAARVQKRDWTPEFPSHAPEWATAMVSVVTDRPAR